MNRLWDIVKAWLKRIFVDCKGQKDKLKICLTLQRAEEVDNCFFLFFMAIHDFKNAICSTRRDSVTRKKCCFIIWSVALGPKTRFGFLKTFVKELQFLKIKSSLCKLIVQAHFHHPNSWRYFPWVRYKNEWIALSLFCLQKTSDPLVKPMSEFPTLEKSLLFNGGL